MSRDFATAKAFLSRNEGGNSVFNHLSNVLLKLAAENPNVRAFVLLQMLKCLRCVSDVRSAPAAIWMMSEGTSLVFLLLLFRMRCAPSKHTRVTSSGRRSYPALATARPPTVRE
jgi:hypothetical protein